MNKPKNSQKKTEGKQQENQSKQGETEGKHQENPGKQGKTEGKQEEQNRETPTVYADKPGKLKPISIKVEDFTREEWEKFSERFPTRGEAFVALMENFFKEPQTIEVEKEVIKEVEVIKEIEVTKEVPVILSPDQVIIRFDENTKEYSRKSRPFLKRDGIITSDDPGEALSQMVNRSVNYFLKNKYDHIINPL